MADNRNTSKDKEQLVDDTSSEEETIDQDLKITEEEK